MLNIIALKIATATEDKLNDKYHDGTYGNLQVTAKIKSSFFGSSRKSQGAPPLYESLMQL